VNETLQKTGVIALCVVVLSLLLGLFIYVPANSFPSEDSAMLYIYSEHLADTGVIAYNVGGGPVEGGTDFLWMVILAGLYKAGFPTYLSAVGLSALALLGTAFVLARLAGTARLSQVCWYALFLLALPQVFAAVQGFSPLVFGAFVLLMYFFYLQERTIGLFVTGLVTCLIRPDGVVFAGPIVLAYLWFDRRTLKRNLILLFIFAVAPGLLYFAWRYKYFGNLLPLPFYVKSNFDRVFGIFEPDALKTNLIFLAAVSPVLALTIPAIRQMESHHARKLVVGGFAMLGTAFLFYSCMRLEQNLAYRFQYPLILIPLAMTAACRLEYPCRKTKLCFPIAHVLVLLLLSPFFAIEGLRTLSMPTENVPYIAKALGRINCRGKMAVTEAGRLPYYSGWHAVDLWGLNTPELARTLVTPEYVYKYNPDLIVLNAHGVEGNNQYQFIDASSSDEHFRREWMNMVENTYHGANSEWYEQWMVPHLNREVCNAPIGKFADLKEWLISTTGYEKNFPVYYLYMIRKNSPCFNEMRKILLSCGAVSYEEFKARKEAWEGMDGGCDR